MNRALDAYLQPKCREREEQANVQVNVHLVAESLQSARPPSETQPSRRVMFAGAPIPDRDVELQANLAPICAMLPPSVSSRFRVYDCNTLCHSSSTWPDKYSSPSQHPRCRQDRDFEEVPREEHIAAPHERFVMYCPFCKRIAARTSCACPCTAANSELCHLPLLQKSRRWSASPSSVQCLSTSFSMSHKLGCGTRQRYCS